jgi:1-acyl-sn-glycerol-3-phosphate acyltransferase
VVVVAETREADPAARNALRDRIVMLAAIHLNGPPDEVLLVPAHTVLKTSSGKIRRSEMRELYDTGSLVTHPRAVWWQVTRLFARAALAASRRVVRDIAAIGFGMYCWVVFTLIAFASLVPLALVARPDARSRLVRASARLFLKCSRIPVEVDGLEHLSAARPAVIAVNHASYVDAIVLTAVLPPDVHFVAKREFAQAPVLGSVLRKVSAYFVDRDDPATGVEDTREVAAAVGRGERVVFFPEGTFTRAPGLAPFRLGAFAISVETGAPVVPVVLRGTRSVLRDQRWLPSRSPVSVRAQAPIMPTGQGWSAALALRERVRGIMLGACGEPDLSP